MSRFLAPSASPYAPFFGFSRAVRVDNHIFVGGTAPIDHKGNTVGGDDVIQQLHQCLAIISHALEAVGTSLNSVVRTRIMLTDIKDWEKVAKVHGEYFKHIKPASTVVQVSAFINPEWRVEIEVDAIVDMDHCID